MACGILIIDKPRDWTSQDVCAKLRGVLRERRIGHGGTLDPMATGVLPVFVGRATRAVQYAVEGDKEYIARLQLGLVTDTQDVTGTVLERHSADITLEALTAVLPRFTGPIWQIPPMYSAIKVNGQKLYDLARKGREVERQPRGVTIHSLKVLEQSAPDAFLLQVGCSKGTYVRTLCHDIGQALGCGGVMADLRRTRVAAYTLPQAHTLDEVLQSAAPDELLLPVDSCFSDHPALTVSGRQTALARNGNPFPCAAADGCYRVYDAQGEFLLLGQCRGGTMTTIKSFFEV